MENFPHYSARRLRALRAKTGLSQENFYEAVGLTQSAGSRHEAPKSCARRRVLPKPVSKLIQIVHEWGINKMILEYIRKSVPKGAAAGKRVAKRHLKLIRGKCIGGNGLDGTKGMSKKRVNNITNAFTQALRKKRLKSRM